MRAHLKALIALVVAGTAAAQTGHTKRSAGAAGRGSGIAAGQVVGIVRPTVFVIPGNSSLFAPPGSFFANVPIIVVPDGRVFADFGRGFEHIVRGCGFSPFTTVIPPTEQPVTIQPVVIQPPVVVNQSPPPPAFTPNIPIPQYAVPVTAPTVASVFGSQPAVINSTACWTTNGRGAFFVAQP